MKYTLEDLRKMFPGNWKFNPNYDSVYLCHNPFDKIEISYSFSKKTFRLWQAPYGRSPQTSDLKEVTHYYNINFKYKNFR